MKECLQSAEFISSSDGNFKVLEDGSVYTTSALSLSAEKKTFTILLKDIQEQVQKKIHVSLVEEEKKVKFYLRIPYLFEILFHRVQLHAEYL